MDSIIDWGRIISDLQRAGLNHHQQAKEAGVSRRAIGSWQAGVHEPAFSAGYRLLDVYRAVFGSTAGPETKRQDIATLVSHHIEQ